MDTALAKLKELRIVPVVAIHDAKDASPLADALLTGGLPCAEITFRTDAAEDAIQAIASRRDMLVGAGTVLTPEQVDRAVDAGAEFIVAPGTNPTVIEQCQKRGIPITPGVATPSDIEQAMSFGLEVLKFFPAGAFGGIKTLKAISAPYRMVKFIPTGGVSADNLADYLAMDCVLACGGSWLCKSDMIASGEFDKITKITAQAVKIAAGT
jgi:2-dehydro-3-deoxyphosphogluconate aldolase/(4S)-4-hydroxy-2-oxoglutarate aldolase